jgi:uncharacterized membrane protein
MLAVGLPAAAAPAEPIVLVEESPTITRGVVTVDAPPGHVYALVTRYAAWPALLSDVSAVTVLAGGAHDARVRFRSRAFGREVAIQFDNVPGRVIRFRGIEGPPGGRAEGVYQLEPIDGGRRTRVTARLYLDIVGPASWFVRDRTIRGMRRAKLAADLADVARYFSGQLAPRVDDHRAGAAATHHHARQLEPAKPRAQIDDQVRRPTQQVGQPRAIEIRIGGA